ncbi:MAG: adenosylcobinamide amidohydrolase [Deltaproteobacteria bacterium]|jgi:adenosylcobinamide amidohydrolase|nr:adenosylcobinamide amidohydrolase [Deltaproteobacteria bacterium]
MLLASPYEGLEIRRTEKLVYARFLKPHLVLSSARCFGGLRDDLEYLCNHQSSEGTDHHGRAALVLTDPQAYQSLILSPCGIPPERSALLGTAANMHLLALQSLAFEELTIAAAVTGGAETNAARAGDPSTGHEGPDGFKSLSLEAPDPAGPDSGTINIMVFINRPLTPGAMVRAVSLATEAKTCALQELGVNSRYSPLPASGTGTDQIGLAALSLEGVKPLAGGGHHLKLGELIGRTVLAAVKEALARQNGMTPDRQCSVKILLERFHRRPDGRYRMTSRELAGRISRYLPPETGRLLESNCRSIFHDPCTAAACAALVHVKDRFTWGILPALVWPEVMGALAGQLAAAVSGRLDRIGEYCRELAPRPEQSSAEDFLNLAARALALGLRDKWPSEEPA